MKEFLEFTFTNFWHFIGVVILLGMILKSIISLFALLIALISKDVNVRID